MKIKFEDLKPGAVFLESWGKHNFYFHVVKNDPSKSKNFSFETKTLDIFVNEWKSMYWKKGDYENVINWELPESWQRQSFSSIFTAKTRD